ncbi:MAG: aminotransferase class I/II-fold pyridoxal phosphate-dependent enzyme [Alphaproteobacteria bacterium]|nr:aminotransferase class I/II-fold pyridoxal phosphate-dependent enzyme [Alphaproteobacteria bacterium]
MRTEAGVAARVVPADMGLRGRIQDLPASEIREIAHRGMGVAGVIPLWFGESDTPTPDFIVRAATEAMQAGKTFYTQNRGIPELRDALAAYHAKLHGTGFGAERITVTASGMNAIMVAMQCLMEPGDNLVIPAPLWPNVGEAARIMGADLRRVPLELTAEGWRLDLDRLFAACNRATRAIAINAPGNPTGWMVTPAEQQAILAFCRQRGIWLIADEVYGRIVYQGTAAPSFASLVEEEDRVLVLNSFSKAWCMTGWRLGWVVAPNSLGQVLDKMNEYNVASAATMVQHAGVAAVTEGEGFVAESVARYRANRDLACEALAACERVHFARPEGAFYLFFRVDGMDDSRAAAHRLLDTAKVGLAPGTAFGPEGRGWLRLCFAVREATLRAALDRLLPHFA